MAQKSASSSRLDSLRGMLPRARRHARRGLALFLTWVLVFQAIYGANTTEAIAEGLEGLGQQIAWTQAAASGDGNNADAQAQAPASDAARTEPIDWTGHTDALVLSSTGLAPDYAATDASGAASASTLEAVTLPSRISASLNLTIDLNASRDPDAASAPTLLAGDSLTVSLPDGVALSAAGAVPVYAIDDEGNATSEQVGELALADGTPKVTLLDVAGGRDSLRCAATLPITFEVGLLGNAASTLVWTLQTSSTGSVRTSALELPSREDVARGLGLLVDASEPAEQASGDAGLDSQPAAAPTVTPTVTVAPSKDRTAAASDFVTAWADNNSPERPFAADLASRREYRLYFQVEGDDTRYPLTTDGRTVSPDAQRLLGLTQDELDEIRTSSPTDGGSEPELVSVSATHADEYTASSAVGLPAAAVTTTVTPGTDEDGNPTSTTTTETRKVTYCITHEVAGESSERVTDGALLYDTAGGESSYLVMAAGKLDADAAPFERECLAAVARKNVNVVLNLGAGSESLGNLYDWLDATLSDGSHVRDHVHLGAWVDHKLYKSHTGEELDETMRLLRASLTKATDSGANSYVLSLYAPLFTKDQGAVDLRLWVDEIENSNVDGYRDYYQVWYDNAGSITTGSGASASFGVGSMTVTRVGNTSFSATKVWLDDDPSARPATTYTLWRYSDKQGQSSLTASQVQFDNGQFASVTMSAEQNAALGKVELGGAGNNVPQNNVTVDLSALFKAQAGGDVNLPKYDQDGYPYVYFVREDIEGQGYAQTMGTIDADGNVEQGSDPAPGYWNGARTERVDAQSSPASRPVGDTPVYDGGTVTNVRTQVGPHTVTKTWNAAAYQDKLSDVVVTMRCQRILKRHAKETYPGSGVWEPKKDPMYDEDGNLVGTYEWTDFEAGPGETPTTQELTGWNAENMSQTLSGNYDTYDPHGEEYVYRWIEATVDKGDDSGHYLSSVDGMSGKFFLDLTDENGLTDTVTFVSHNDPSTGVVTNRYVNTTERHVDKLWAKVDEDGNVVTDEDGNTQWTQDAQPYGDGRDVGSVSVRLVRDGELVGDFEMDGVADEEATKLKNPDGSPMMGDAVNSDTFETSSSPSTVQETSPWHLDFSNLPEFAPDGHRYSYQLLEGNKSGFWGERAYDAESRTVTLRNTPGTGGESSLVRVNKRWLDGGNNTARPGVLVGVYAKHDMANAAGTVRYGAGDKVGEVMLDSTGEWTGELSVPIGGLTNDDFTISELSTEVEGTSLDSTVAAGETRVVTKAQAQAQANAGNASYEALLASWGSGADDSQRMLTTDYAYEVSYGTNDALDSLEVTNRRVGLAHIDIYKSWSDVGADESSRPKADFCISNIEGQVTFSYDENGELLANVEGMGPQPVRDEGTVSARDSLDASYAGSRLNRDNTEVSGDGHTLLVHVGRLDGDHHSYTIQGLPKYNAAGDVLRWNVTESWDGDAGDYVSSQTGYSEQFGGQASPWHHVDLMEYSFTNKRSATKDVTFHTRWYDHYVKDSLNQRVDIYLSLYRRVQVYDADGNPELDSDGNCIYSVEPVEGYQHYDWVGEGESGQDALYSQYATVSGLAKYDEHGGEIVYYASVHNSQSDFTYANLDYTDPWFTYGASADDPNNAGWPGSASWDDANAGDSFKASSPNNLQVDASVSGNAGYAVREDGTFNFGLSASVTIPGEKLWANLPAGFAREDLPSIEFYLQRRVAGGHYDADGTWLPGGNNWGELSVTAGERKGDYSVLSYDSGGTADYDVADGTTAVAWTDNLTQVRGNRYSFTLAHFGDNDGEVGDAADTHVIPKYDRNGRLYEYRVREIIDGLIRKSEDGSDVPGGFDASDLKGGKTPEEGANGVYTVHYGASESYRINNFVNDSAKGRLTVKKLFSGLEPGDLLPDCTFALYRYYVRPNGEASQAQLVETKSMSLAGERANANGRFMKVMSFDDLDVYTPAGTYWVYFVAEQPVNGYHTSVGTGDLVYGSSWTGADMLQDGSVRTDGSATMRQLSEGSALYDQPTNSLVADDYSVDFTFQNSYYGQDEDFGKITGKKYWFDQHNAAGTRPDDIELAVTRRYANGQLDATDNGAVSLQSTDPHAPNYVSWNKAAGPDGAADVWTYTISNLERIAPDGSYWRYEVSERGTGGTDYLVSSNHRGGTVDMANYAPDALSVGSIDNYLKTKVGFTKTWVGDSSDRWRQRPVVYVTLQARVRQSGGAWGAWDEAGSVYEQTFGLSLERKAPFSNYSCPEGSVLPGGQNTVERISSDSTGNYTSNNVWRDLPSGYERDGQTYEIDYRVVESRLVYDKKGDQVVIDVASPDANGAYGSVEGAYHSSQTEGSWVSGDSYKHSTITNTLVDATSVSVEKTWDDDGNAWATRPGTTGAADTWSATFVLQRRVSGGQWRWLTSYGTNLSSPFSSEGVLDARLQTVTVNGSGNSASASFGDLPTRAQSGATYEYRAVELVRGSYEVDEGEVLATSGTASLVVASGAAATSAYTNKLRTVSLSGAKTWNDWGTGISARLSPESCGIHLTLQRSTDGGSTWEAAARADGSEPSPTWSVGSDGAWTYAFDGLPESDRDGRAYTYRAVETDGSVPGFFSDKSAAADGTAADGRIANVATRLTFDKVGDGTTGSAGSLRGVRFVMSRDGLEVATWERAEDGTVTSTVGGVVQAGAAAGYIVGLPTGVYTVHEAKTPAGYVAVADFTVTIGVDGSVLTSAGSVVASDGAAAVAPERGNACVTVPNSVFRAQVSLEKYFLHGADAAKVAVPGMTFDLYRTQADGTGALVARGITTDAHGTWISANSTKAVERNASGESVLGTFYQRLSDGLPQGDYYLLETGTSALTHGTGSRSSYEFSVTAADHAHTVAVSAENEEFSASAHLSKADAETLAAVDGASFELLYKPEGSSAERSLGVMESGHGYVLDATCAVVESVSAADAGKLLVSGLKKGSYRLVETSNVGYSLPSDRPQVSWVVTDADHGHDIDLADDAHPWTGALTQGDKLLNYPLHGSVTFKKLDDDGQGLNGAEFKLQVKQGDAWADVAGGASLLSGHGYAADVTSAGVAGLAVTGALEDGRITVTNLPWGAYRLVETQTIPGYVGKTSDGWPVSSEAAIDRKNVAASVAAPLDMGTLSNHKATITIKKASWGDGAPLAGAHFTVRASSGGRFLDGATEKHLTTDASGIAQADAPSAESDGMSNELAGAVEVGQTYVITETQAPAGYATPDPASFTVRISEDGTLVATGEASDAWRVDTADGVSVVTARDKAIALQFKKVDENDQPLTGAQFTLSGVFAAGEGTRSISPDGADAMAPSPEDMLEGEVYTLRESQPPVGYTTVPDLMFRVAHASDGEVRIEPVGELPAGWGVSEDGVAATATDKPVQFLIQKIQKKSADGEAGLANAKFDITGLFVDDEGKVTRATYSGITNESGTILSVDGIAAGTPVQVTDEDGTVTSEVADGVYELSEASAPYGYKPSGSKLKVRIAADGSMSVVGEAAGGWSLDARNATVTLADDPIHLAFAKVANGTEQPLEGAEFSISGVFAAEDGTLENDGRTQELAGLTIDDLNGLRFVAGESYRLSETKAPAGYELIRGWVEFDVTEQGTFTRFNSSASNGSYGLSANMLTLTARDLPVEVTITKSSQDGTRLAGAAFSLVPDKGSAFSDGSTGALALVTDASGVARLEGAGSGASLSARLVAGNTYVLTETSAPAGYKRLSGEVRLTVGPDGTVSLAGADSVANGMVALKGTDAISVTDDAVPFAIVKYGEAGPDGTRPTLAGATFSVTPQAGSSFADGTTDGRKVTTDSDGRAGSELSGMLVVGNTYGIREVMAPAGYTRIDQELVVRVTDDGSLAAVFGGVEEAAALRGYEVVGDELHVFTGSVADEATSLTVMKRDADNPLVGLDGATFSLAPVDGFTFADGSSDAREVTTSTVGGVAGMASFDRALLRADATSVYELRETRAPDGYALSGMSMLLRVDFDGVVVPVSRSGSGYVETGAGDLAALGFARTDDVATLIATDKPVDVTLRKTDEDASALAGATFTLTPADGTNDYGEPNRFANGSETDVLELTSTVQGLLLSRQLVAGNTYELEETAAPEGYAVTGGRVLLHVNGDGTLAVSPVDEGAPAVGEAASTEAPCAYEVGEDGVTVTLADPATRLRIAKVGSDGSGCADMAGARFTVSGRFANASEQGTITLETGADGLTEQLTAKLVAGESYVVREVAAPAGYELLDVPFTLWVRQDGSIVSGGDVAGWSLSSAADGTFTLTATDDPTPVPDTPATPGEPTQTRKVVPQTGDDLPGSLMASIAAAGLALIALGLRRRRRA